MKINVELTKTEIALITKILKGDIRSSEYGIERSLLHENPYYTGEKKAKDIADRRVKVGKVKQLLGKLEAAKK